MMVLKVFEDTDAGPALYQGSQSISESLLVALYHKSGTTLVVPLSSQEQTQLQHQVINTQVELNSKGLAKTQGPRHGR